MTDIKFLKDRIIFDGHSDRREECETITLMCNNLAKSKDFKTVKYENGYAEFERIGRSKELKFAPTESTLTINFDSNITKVAVTEQGLEWTSSGQTNNVSVSTTGGANNWTFTVTLADGYVIDTVTPGSSESSTSISDITTTTFISNMANGGAQEMELTITSKLATAKNIPAGYFTWNGAKRLVHADDLYNSDGTKKNVAVSYVEITSPSSATNGNLTQAQLSTLQASKENKIIFDNEVYICQDVGHDSGFLVYTHVGRDNTTNYWLKCIGITISTLGWVKTEMQLVGKEYVDNLIVTTLNTPV